MSTALTKHEAGLPAMQMSEAELLEVLQSSLYPGANPASIKMVLGYCKASGLDPMQKPVHIVPMWDSKARQMRDVVMPGIGLYRTQAARTGEHVGTDEPVFGPMVEMELSGVKIVAPEWCKVTVYRSVMGQKCAYTAIEYWIENYATAGKESTAPNAMWKKRSRGQIAKCAEAQALRKGFPEVGNQPTAEEMEGKTFNDFELDPATGDITPLKPARQTPPDYSQADFDKNLPSWRKAVESGRTTPENLIVMVSTKGVLTEQMKQAMRDLAKTADVTDVQPKPKPDPQAQPAVAGADDSDLPWKD